MKLLTPYYIILEYLLIGRIKVYEKTGRSLPKQWNYGKKTIILIPGIHSTCHGFIKVGSFLSNKGYRILTIKDLGNNTMNVNEASIILESFIKEYDLNDIVILAHSKGGLIAKYFLDNSKEKKRIKKIISIATPYKGSMFSYIIRAKDMYPNSKTITKFKKNNNRKIINLYPSFDNHVIPNKNLLLDGAKNVRIDVIGHTRILFAKETLNIINDIL